MEIFYKHNKRKKNINKLSKNLIFLNNKNKRMIAKKRIAYPIVMINLILKKVKLLTFNNSNINPKIVIVQIKIITKC